jgi:GNAT superfamily N-acetyltransferase
VRSLEDCKRAMVADHAPSTSVQITEDWFRADKGAIPEPHVDDRIIGAHAVTLVGYNDRDKRISFVNSWGLGWGDQGFGTISYRHYHARAVESWVQSPVSAYTMTAKSALESLRSHESNMEHVYELIWRTRDIIRGGILRVFEIYDAANDERIGWAFAVLRDGFLDIEELFVRPAYRRRGYGRRLAKLVLQTSQSLQRPIRLWVSYADCGEENRASLDGLLEELGLSLWNSPVRWAAYLGLADSSPHELDPVVMPDRPALSRGAWTVAKAAVIAASVASGHSETIAATAPVRGAIVQTEQGRPSIDDLSASQVQDRHNVDDDDLIDVGYDMVLTAPPREIIPCFARIEAIVKGREDLPMRDSDWEDILVEDDED